MMKTSLRGNDEKRGRRVDSALRYAHTADWLGRFVGRFLGYDALSISKLQSHTLQHTTAVVLNPQIEIRVNQLHDWKARQVFPL